MNDTRFSTGDAARAAGVAQMLLASWADRHVLDGVEPCGHGRPRGFTYPQVLQAAICGSLQRQGVPPRDAAAAARVFTHPPPGTPACALNRDHETLLVMRDSRAEGEIADWRRAGDILVREADDTAITIVNLGAIVRQVNTRLGLPVPNEAYR